MKSAARLTRAESGQAVILLVVLLAFVVVVGLAEMALTQEASDRTSLQQLADAAAWDAVHSYDDSSLAGDTPAIDDSAARSRALQTLSAGLGAFSSRVDAAAVLAAAIVRVLAATPTDPQQNPDTGTWYHHLTVCVAMPVTVGLVESDGPGATYTVTACAQLLTA